MAIEVVMPRLGWTMEEGTLVEWRKAPGELVQVGEILFTVENEKALNEVEAFDAGTLCIPGNAPKPGDTVPLGTVLGYLLAEGETPPDAVPPVLVSPGHGASVPMPVPGSLPVAAVHELPAASTPARGSAPAPSVTESVNESEATVFAEARRITISPRARKLAKELGVDWQGLTGTGRTGRITEGDIRAAAQAGVETEAVTDPNVATTDRVAPGSTGDNTVGDDVDAERLPLSPTRRAIAQRLVVSHRDGAPVTLTAEFDATDLVVLRGRTKPRPGYNDYLIRFVALALARHPALNSSLVGKEILRHQGVHIGFAVDTEAGLLVPVVRDANLKSVAQIARESAGLSGRAWRGELTSEQMQGGTFTITNLGAAGIDAFTPIINPPQGAILGVGRIAERPAVHGGQIVPRWLTVVSLTFDHRLIDGGPAARFLATLRGLVESPQTSLASATD